MIDDRAFERYMQDWLAEGSDRTPQPAVDAVLLAVKTTPQERDFRIPWRTRPMTTPLRLAATIAIVAVVGVAALNLIDRGPGIGAGPTPTPTPTATPSPTAASTAAPTSTNPSPTLDTSAWVEYTSDRYGLSISHPADWTERPGDHAWTLAADADWLNTAADSFIAPFGSIRISAWSVPVEPGTSLDAWIQAYCLKNTTPCTGILDRAVPVYAEKRDRHPGLLVPFADDIQAFFLNGDRIYVVASWQPEGTLDSRRLVEAFALSMCLGCGAPAATTPPPP